MFEIYLIDKVKKDINSISRLFKEVTNLKITKTLTELEDLNKIFHIKKPLLVLLGTSYTIEDIETFSKSGFNPDLIKIVLLVKTNSVLMLKKAIELSIHDVIEFPFDKETINKTIRRADMFFRSRRVESFPFSEEHKKVEKKESKKIMIFSTKGGNGKSFLATNLAIDLFNKSKKSVVLLDLNYYSGDIAIMLDLFPKNTIYEILPIMDQLDYKTIDDFLSIHNSGIKVLPCPIFSTQAESISIESTMAIVDLLSKANDYLVIDTGSFFSETVLLLLETIDYLCMVSSMDVPSIKNLKLSLMVLRKLKFPVDKIFIIINRANSNVGMAINEIEATIERKIDVKIPSSRMVPITINKGIPIIMNQPRSPVSKSISKLTELIIK